MKPFITAITSLLIFLSASYADEVSHRAAVEEYLIITKTDQMMKPMFQEMEKMMLGLSKQMGVPEEEIDMFNKYVSGYLGTMEDQFGWDKIKDDLIKIHQETFTEAEIISFIEFYKTPAGRAYVEKDPLLMRKITEVSQKKIPAMIERLQAFEALMKEDIQKERAKKQAQEINKAKGM
ncbi:MAG: DUF2059 domain-containing protein [Nitrospirae bacterium]|nr:DUF2059 domain-containing protein [Nitrospirota bacterium]